LNDIENFKQKIEACNYEFEIKHKFAYQITKAIVEENQSLPYFNEVLEECKLDLKLKENILIHENKGKICFNV